jgi:hypothetical protein
MKCDFCGADNATEINLPQQIDPTGELANTIGGGWGHPRTGNACWECAIKQMALASGGRLVERVTPEAVEKTVFFGWLGRAIQQENGGACHFPLEDRKIIFAALSGGLTTTVACCKFKPLVNGGRSVKK